MDDAQGWDSLAWRNAVRAVCLNPPGANAMQSRLRGLACELAEVFAADLAHAVTTFPRHVMRAWHVDQAEILLLINQRSPISQGTPRWREVEVELATICISALESGLCGTYRDDVFAQLDLQMYVRRICFESIFEFFFFILRGYAPDSRNITRESMPP